MSDPILLEGRNLILSEGTGIATYAAVLASTLVSLGHRIDILYDTPATLTRNDAATNEIRIHDAAARPDRIGRILDHLHAHPFGISARPVGPSSALAELRFPGLSGFEEQQAGTRLFERAQAHLLRYGRPLTVQPVRRPRLFHATHPAPIRVPKCPNVYTIHDLVPLRLPHATLDSKRAFLATVQQIARTADLIITVSEHSRRDIVELLGVEPDRLVNTYQATRGLARRALSDAERERELAGFDLVPDGYFLFVGAIEPKKNVARLIDAYLASGADRPLVIVGRNGWGHDDVDRRLGFLRERSLAGSDRRSGPRVLRLPYLPTPIVTALLESASALLFPSLYEGFGLPVLEALELGTPVLASDAAALPEIVGDAGLLVPPTDVEAIAAAIRRLGAEGELRRELARRGPVAAERFSPARYRERIAAAYDRLL